MLASLAGKPSRSVVIVLAVDLFLVRIVLTLEKVGDALADGRDTVACAVGANGADLLQQPFGSLNDIVLVSKGLLQSLLILQEQRVLDQTQDLAEECDGLLVQLLRVADVGRDDLGKGQAGLAAAELGSELL